MTDCRRWRIEGRVQGVFFRASTRRHAEKLGLTGHAINLDDGAVDVLACGEGDKLDALEAWLHKGPVGARVMAVKRRPAGESDSQGAFRTG
jgi:acylphosphatase